MLPGELSFFIIFNIQTLCAVRNSGISLADGSALMVYNARFSYVNNFLLTPRTFYELYIVSSSYIN